MAVFITGGNGHIGSWIAYLFARKNRDVIIYDLSKKVPQYLKDYKEKIHFIEGDILDFARLVNVIKEYHQDIEGIIHTVAIMGEFVPLNPYFNIRLNVMGLLNSLEVARIFGIQKVLFTSTGAVYGKKKGKVRERDCLDPQDLYAASKASAELIGRQYADAYHLDFRVGRLFFVYGPGRFPSTFFTLYKITFGVLEGVQGLKSSKGSEQIIDFTYVLDAAQGMYLLFEKKKPDSRVYNLSSGESYKVEDVVELCKKYTHYPVEISLGKGILMNRVEGLNITKAQKELGYQPEYHIEEGVKLYSDWIKSQKDTTC
jgi:nucleoside-diphosphate-sugar epimerase